jgi:hypothetical protein
MRLLLAATVALAACDAQGTATIVGPDVDGAVGPNDLSGPPVYDLTPSSCAQEPGLDTTVPDGPPPISGGTLIVLPGGATAAVSDPEADVVYLVAIVNAAPTTVRSVALMAHDEPGRLVADGAGKVHVVLRRAGAVVTIDPTSATITDRTAVCATPRGIAYDATLNQVDVACLDGQLISLPAGGGAAVRTVQLDEDLRDVLAVNGTLMVSRFRPAELLTLAADGTIASRTQPGAFTGPNGTFTPSVAWRTFATPTGVAMLHQRGSTGTVVVSGAPDGGAIAGYGVAGASNCVAGGSVVQSVVSVLSGTNANTSPGPFPDGTLAIDAAVTPDGSMFAVASPAANGANLVYFSASSLTDGSAATCMPAVATTSGAIVAVAALDNQHFVFQTQTETNDPTVPAVRLSVATVGAAGSSVTLRNGGPAFHPGHVLFHTRAGVNIACASCHPEGGDDGRIWQFDIGNRRTLQLRGGLRGTEPFLWNGNDADFFAVMNDFFTGRMHGAMLSCDQMQAVSNWVESIPKLTPTVTDPAAVARGQTLFQDPVVACISCHYGPHFTNNATLNVTTGGFFQVPRLVDVAFHAPYLHDGRAATLLDRFNPMIGGADDHGTTSQLTAAQIDDLIAYLQSL